MAWKTRLNAAIRAEVAAEKAATKAETERRATWWETSWALADVPRPEWGEAQAEYVQRTGHTKATADRRRQVGTRFTETSLAAGLPIPRFAQEAATWLGKNPEPDKVAEAIKMLADAERDEVSVREFHLLLTGTSWTATPENLTEAEEDAIAVKVIKRRPQRVIPEIADEALGTAIQEGAERARKRRQKERDDEWEDMTPDERVEATATEDALEALSNLAGDMLGESHRQQEAILGSVRLQRLEKFVDGLAGVYLLFKRDGIDPAEAGKVDAHIERGHRFLDLIRMAGEHPTLTDEDREALEALGISAD